MGWFRWSVWPPLTLINLRAAYAPFLVETDASMEGLAGVETKLPANFVMELCRHSLQRSTWSTLLPAGKSWKKAHDMLEPQEELEDEEYQVHPLWELCARGCAYRTTWKAPVHKPVHINLLEMKAHLREERRIACKACFPADSICAGLSGMSWSYSERTSISHLFDKSHEEELGLWHW